MIHRERVLLALDHIEPDRVPLDIGGITCGIHRDAYKNLLDYLGIKEEIKIIDPAQQVAQISEKVLEFFGVDTRRIQVEAVSPQIEISEIKPGYMGFRDKWGVVWGAPKNREHPLYYDIIESPLADFKEKDLDHYDWPELISVSQLKALRKYAEAIKLKGDYALVSGVYGSIWEISWAMRGFEKFFLDLVINPSFAHKLLDIITQYWLSYGEIFFKELGDFFDVVHAGDDLGTQEGPMISLKTFREFLKPRYDLIYKFIHKKTKAKIFYHSCGSITSLLPDLIDIGVEILNPVQTSAYNMSPEYLEKNFGTRIVFWGGGVDNLRVLPCGLPAEVKEDVRKRLEIFMPGGGYIFSSIHNIQSDVPPQNIIAMWEALQEYGVYED